MQEVQAPDPVLPHATLDRVQHVVSEVNRSLHRADELDQEDGDQRLRTQLLTWVPFS